MSILEHAVIIKALAFASQAHAGVARKWSGEPYIEHPMRVALRLAAVGLDPDVVAAGILHDVYEDCGVSAEELEAEFGRRITAFVLEVSKPKIAGSREFRKAAFRVQLAASSFGGASIKLADELDNSSNVVEMNPEFASLCLPEMIADLAVLGHGHPELVAALAAQLAAQMEKLTNL